MTEFLLSLLNLSILIFAIASMLSVGFTYTVREILSPLRNVRAVMRTLIANFVLVPLLGYMILQVIPLKLSLSIGLFLISSAAGAPFLIKLTALARQNVAISATLLVLLIPITIIYLPIMVPLALPRAEISAFSIAMPLILSILLPLAVGLFVRTILPNWAQRLQPLTAGISSFALIVLIVTTFIVHFQSILEILGEGALLAAFLLTSGSFLLGYLSGAPDGESREELAFATAQRNVAAATVIATQAVELSGTIIMVVVTSMVGLAILFPIAFIIRNRKGKNVNPKL